MLRYHSHLLALEANKKAQALRKPARKKRSFLGPGGVLMTPSIDGIGKKRGSSKRNSKGQFVKE